MAIPLTSHPSLLLCATSFFCHQSTDVARMKIPEDRSMKKLAHNRTLVISLSVAAAFVAVLTYVTAFASPPASTIHACYNDTNGSLRRVNSPADCHTHETAISWNASGPAGPTGPPGPPGPAGPAGPGSNLTTFRHTRTAGNICGPGGNFSYIDNPAINGNAGATIFVTAIVGIKADRSNTNPNSNWYLTYTGGSAFATCPAQRWLIAGGDVSTGGQFNVMIVGP